MKAKDRKKKEKIQLEIEMEKVPKIRSPHNPTKAINPKTAYRRRPKHKRSWEEELDD